jgi:hypothetical protein
MPLQGVRGKRIQNLLQFLLFPCRPFADKTFLQSPLFSPVALAESTLFLPASKTAKSSGKGFDV